MNTNASECIRTIALDLLGAKSACMRRRRLQQGLRPKADAELPAPQRMHLVVGKLRPVSSEGSRDPGTRVTTQDKTRDTVRTGKKGTDEVGCVKLSHCTIVIMIQPFCRDTFPPGAPLDCCDISNQKRNPFEPSACGIPNALMKSHAYEYHRPSPPC